MSSGLTSTAATVEIETTRKASLATRSRLLQHLWRHVIVNVVWTDWTHNLSQNTPPLCDGVWQLWTYMLYNHTPSPPPNALALTVGMPSNRVLLSIWFENFVVPESRRQTICFAVAVFICRRDIIGIDRNWHCPPCNPASDGWKVLGKMTRNLAPYCLGRLADRTHSEHREPAEHNGAEKNHVGDDCWKECKKSSCVYTDDIAEEEDDACDDE